MTTKLFDIELNGEFFCQQYGENAKDILDEILNQIAQGYEEKKSGPVWLEHTLPDESAIAVDASSIITLEVTEATEGDST